jgi:predicted RNA-binding protein with PUA-like domain
MQKKAPKLWLFKTDPDTFSFEDLAAGREGEVWDGVTNALALQHLRTVAKGDEVLIYHTGKERAIVGTARVTRGAYPDPKAGDPKIVVVDVKADRTFPRPVTLAELKADPLFASFDLIRLGRLSVMPVPESLRGPILAKARFPG